MNPVLLDTVTILAKWGLSLLTTYLVSHHIATAPEADRFSQTILAHLALWVPAAMSLALMLWGKLRARKQLVTALSMPVGSTENDVKAKIASGVPTPALSTPANSVPGIPVPKGQFI